MTLLAPAGLAALALLGPLALWYVLRARRPRRLVGSTLLWRPLDEAATAAVPWTPLRPDRTFWLIAAAIVLGSLAIAQPALPVPLPLGDHTIFVLDASGSMLAEEDGATRLELARGAVVDLAGQLGAGQRISVVAAGQRARVLLASSADPSAARRALDRVDATHGPADHAGALRLAAALVRPGEEAVTRVLTDGPLPTDVADLAPPGMVVDAVGEDRPNLAVVRLELTGTRSGSARAYVAVRNLGPLPADADLELRVDGVVAGGRRLALGPRGSEDVLLPLALDDRPGGGVVEARVRPVGSDVTGARSSDALAIDDAAYAVIPSSGGLRVVVVGEDNLFLDAALGAAITDVEVARVPMVPDDLAEVDLLVVDRAAAPARLGVPALLIAPSVLPDGVTTAGPSVANPAITAIDSSHPLVADVDLSGVAITEAQPLTAAELQPVVAGPGGPLLLAGRLGSVPAVVLTFDLLASNLPLEVAFPVLVANAAVWLAGPDGETAATAGQDVRLDVPPGATAATATPPGGGPGVPVDAGRAVLAVPRAGVWRIAWSTGAAARGDSVPLAVNPHPAEADLARGRPASTAPAGTPGAAAGAAVAEAAEPVREGRLAFGRELLGGVVALILLEAFLRHREARGATLGAASRARRRAAA